MITDEDVEQSIEFLQSSALKTAQAKANRIYLDEYRKFNKDYKLILI